MVYKWGGCFQINVSLHFFLIPHRNAMGSSLGPPPPPVPIGSPDPYIPLLVPMFLLVYSSVPQNQCYHCYLYPRFFFSPPDIPIPVCPQYLCSPDSYVPLGTYVPSNILILMFPKINVTHGICFPDPHFPPQYWCYQDLHFPFPVPLSLCSISTYVHPGAHVPHLIYPSLCSISTYIHPSTYAPLIGF